MQDKVLLAYSRLNVLIGTVKIKTPDDVEIKNELQKIAKILSDEIDSRLTDNKQVELEPRKSYSAILDHLVVGKVHINFRVDSIDGNNYNVYCMGEKDYNNYKLFNKIGNSYFYMESRVNDIKEIINNDHGTFKNR